jgi:DeoR/GlpR family transcriptional regulator of sugar metabolism
VCLLGGFVRQTSLATSGPFAETMAAQINADLALISPDGLGTESGLTFTHASDSALAKCMSNKARRTVAIAVAAKLRRTERVGALPLSAVSEIITGCRDAALLQTLRKRGVKLTLVDAGEGKDT